MMRSASTHKKIVVAGDCTIDWYLARIRTSEREGSLGDPLLETGAFRQPGGALLLGRLIKEIAKNLKVKYEVLANDLPENESPRLRGFWHSFTICAEFPSHAKHRPSQKAAWRIDEFVGASKQLAIEVGEKHAMATDLSKDDGSADILIIDFLGMQDFRKNRDLWPKSFKSKRSPWVLFSWSRPNFKRDNEFVTEVKEQFGGQLVAIVTLNDLRLCDIQVSQGLSWERTAQDIVREMHKRRDFAGFAHVVVSLDTEGVVVLSKVGDGKWDAKLYYDPKYMEGSWAEAYAGTMWGHKQCLVGGIALQMMHASEFPKQFRQGVRSGLSAARKLHEDGFTVEWDADQHLEDLRFPVAEVARNLIQQQVSSNGLRQGDVADGLTGLLEIESNRSPFLEETIPEPAAADEKRSSYWTILAKRGRSDRKRSQLTREIVANGFTVLESKTPIGRFSELFTVDRKEMESLRSISALISEYNYLKTLNRPLSIAVFGFPGSGKSFAIKSVTKALSLRGSIAELEFNLSQFGKPEDLFGALHQVRDVGLSGKLPLVFWDEFDTIFEQRPLGWLQYFLAPMQDAKSHVGQVTHFIGRAIFVFAGGTSPTMENFTERAREDDGKKAKGPDFLSRLKGYVDVQSLDHPCKGSICELDFHTEVRRAILLRSLLLRFAPDLVNRSKGQLHVGINWGIRQAFLRIPKYNYGARSMESIIQMSLLKGKSRFELSSLPSSEQLNLHVDGAKFMELARREVPNEI